jgi:hypothetical protein
MSISSAIFHGSIENNNKFVKATHLCIGEALGTEADGIHDSVAQLEDAGDAGHDLSFRLPAVGSKAGANESQPLSRISVNAGAFRASVQAAAGKSPWDIGGT